MSEPGRAVPTRDELTEPFWAAAREGRLLAPRSTATGELHWPPRLPVSAAGDGVEWTELSGEGTVFSYSVVNRSSHAYPPTPYVLALVELREGITMITNIVDVDPGAVHIGMPVRVTFEEIDAETALPVFIPSQGAGSDRVSSNDDRPT